MRYWIRLRREGILCSEVELSSYRHVFFTCSLQIRPEKFQSFSEKLTAVVLGEHQSARQYVAVALWATYALRTRLRRLRRGKQRSGYSRLGICNDRRRAIQL